MDLKEGWEKKALIGVGVVVLIIIIYAYFVPYTGTPDEVLPTETAPVQTVPVPFSQPTANNTTTNNSTNGTLLNSEQAKNIALNANPGYIAGSVTQQNIQINGTSYTVWKVDISKTNPPSKLSVIVDAASGRILQTTTS
jgi:hypothetical protein